MTSAGRASSDFWGHCPRSPTQHSTYLQPGPRSRPPGGPHRHPGELSTGPRQRCQKGKEVVLSHCGSTGGASPGFEPSPSPMSFCSLRNPAFAGAPACGTAPGHLPRIHCATPGEPEKSRVGCAGRGGVGRARRSAAATQTAPRAHSGGSPRFSRSTCGSMRIPPKAGASAAAGSAEHGARGCGSGAQA